MTKPLPDQSVFGPKEDLTAENPFYEKWLYREDKEGIGCLPSHMMPGNAQRELLNRSPTLRASKKKVVPQGTNIGSYSPYLIKVNWK